ncbi:MAG: hypothetical protein OQJ89_14120 [Kangiellaceae bacterium]|nr:hypothetical protein [Kangiellaceae bacterium]MCW9018103.1 hypothetical protein [Kangiellaceae bacterium]
MKKFIKNGLKLFLIVLVINIALLILVTPGYFSPYQKYKLDYSTYILADSHGLAINDYAEEFGIFNFSAASDSYSDMARKFKFLLENSDVKRVILTVDDHILSPYRDKHNNNDRSVIYLNASEVTSNYSLTKEWIQRYFVLLNSKVRDYLMSFLKAQVKTVLKKKTNKDKMSWAQMDLSTRRAIAQTRYALQFNYKAYSSIMQNHFKEIVEICKRKDIEVIGMRYPLSKVYLELVDDDKEVLKLADDLKIRVLDFKRAFEDKPEYFMNQDHLNREGGRALANLINQNL